MLAEELGKLPNPVVVEGAHRLPPVPERGARQRLRQLGNSRWTAPNAAPPPAAQLRDPSGAGDRGARLRRPAAAARRRTGETRKETAACRWWCASSRTIRSSARGYRLRHAAAYSLNSSRRRRVWTRLTRDLRVLLIVHAELVAGLEPWHHFLNPVQVHQVGAMDAPEHVAVEIGLEFPRWCGSSSRLPGWWSRA